MRQAKTATTFIKLLEIIGSEGNKRLAYRNLKKNNGSATAGTDGKTIDDIKNLSDYEVINTVRFMLADYKPSSVRRVLIPKPGSDKSVRSESPVSGTGSFNNAFCKCWSRYVNLSSIIIPMDSG